MKKKNFYISLITVSISNLFNISPVSAQCIESLSRITCSGDMTGQSYTNSNAAHLIILQDGTKIDSIHGDDYINFAENFSQIFQVTGSTVNAIYGDSSSDYIKEGAHDAFTIDRSAVNLIYGDSVALHHYGTYTSGHNSFTIRDHSNISAIGEQYTVDTTYTQGFTLLTGYHLFDVSDSNLIGDGLIGSNIIIDNIPTSSSIDIKPKTTLQNIFTLNNSTGSNIIGSQLINNSSTTVNWQVADNLITLNNSTVNNIYGQKSEGLVNASGGNDTILLNDSTVTGNIDSGFGNDSIILSGNKTYVHGSINGNTGINTLKFSRFNSDFTAIHYTNFDVVSLADNTDIDFGDHFTTDQSRLFLIDSSSSIIMSGSGAGRYTINANTINNGTFDFSDHQPNDQLIINGNLSGQGTYIIDVGLTSADNIYLSGQLLETQKVAAITNIHTSSNIEQSWKAYNTMPDIVVFSAPNDLDPTNESVIFAPGNALASNPHFGRTTGSPFIWYLHQSGTDWVISSYKGVYPGQPPSPNPKPIVNPEIPAYSILSELAFYMNLSQVETMHQRLGVLRGDSTESQLINSNSWSIWTRGGYNQLSDKADKQGFEFDGDYKGFNLGFDRGFKIADNLKLITGFYFNMQDGHFNTTGKGVRVNGFSPATIDVDAQALGAYASLFHHLTYLDFSMKYGTSKNRINADGITSTLKENSNSVSLEIGQGFIFSNQWLIEPQAQLIYMVNDWNDFHDSINDISFTDKSTIVGRLGLRIQKPFYLNNNQVITPWVRVSELHNFDSSSTINYAGYAFQTNETKDLTSFEMGLSYVINPNVMLYGSTSYLNDFKDTTLFKGELGLRISW